MVLCDSASATSQHSRTKKRAALTWRCFRSEARLHIVDGVPSEPLPGGSAAAGSEGFPGREQGHPGRRHQHPTQPACQTLLR